MMRRDPGLAAIASFFVWGLGHTYHGRFWVGFGLALLQAFLVWTMLAAPGFLLGLAETPSWSPAVWLLGILFYIPVWIAQVVAAFRSTEAANRADEDRVKERRRQDAELARLAAELRRGGTSTSQSRGSA
ncbi:MAG: hypothetical protein AB1609_18190 [Bacillota bacterium]